MFIRSNHQPATGTETNSRHFCTILAVDDSPINLNLIKRMLNHAGYSRIITCEDSRRVLDICGSHPIDIVLLDLRMPHITGQELLPEIKRMHPQLHVIIVTALTDTQMVISCMRAGAFDYVVKPIESELLLSAIRRAERILRLEKENQSLRKAFHSVRNPAAFEKIVTRSPKMEKIFAAVESIAPSPWPILVSGETGVGKEMIVRIIHRLSRVSGKFVSVNAAGLDDHMFSDTLFGHVKGAFTGADRQKGGLLQKATGGTIFLDEIGDLNMSSQVKLLRLIQEGEYMQLGGDKELYSDARIVTATNQDLWSLQRAGTFRKDLNYRLRTHHIHIPPLRERMEDLPLLVDFFTREAAAVQSKKRPAVPKALINRLRNYTFPGNIRELRSLLFDAVSRNRSGKLSIKLLESHLRDQDASLAGNLGLADDTAGRTIFPHPLPTLQQMGDLLVQEAMRRSNQNQTVAAEMVGISQPALSRRLKKLK